MVMVKMPRCMSFLGSTNAYDEPIGIHTARDLPERSRRNFRNPDGGRTFRPNKLEDVGLDTCNHNIPLSSREFPSFDKPEPQPQSSPSFPSLDVCLGDKRGPVPPIKPYSPYSFRIKIVDHLTIHTPPSPHVASSHPKDVYCYYHPCMDDPKKHYGFKPGLLGQSGSLGVNFLNLEMIEDDWQLESKEVSFLEEGLNLPIRPKELEKVIFDEEKPGSSLDFHVDDSWMKI
ncbi:hypothetical protein Tco_0007798 [Tanacetum coccineum]